MPTGIEFTLVRTITVAGFAAEGDPNVTAPTGKTFAVDDRRTGQGGDGLVRGHTVKFVFTDNAGAYVAGGTVDFTTWFKDSNAKGWWTALASQAGAAGSLAFTAPVVGEIFQRVTAIAAPGGGTKVQVWAASRVSV